MLFGFSFAVVGLTGLALADTIEEKLVATTKELPQQGR